MIVLKSSVRFSASINVYEKSSTSTPLGDISGFAFFFAVMNGPGARMDLGIVEEDQLANRLDLGYHVNNQLIRKSNTSGPKGDIGSLLSFSIL